MSNEKDTSEEVKLSQTEKSVDRQRENSRGEQGEIAIAKELIAKEQKDSRIFSGVIIFLMASVFVYFMNGAISSDQELSFPKMNVTEGTNSESKNYILEQYHLEMSSYLMASSNYSSMIKTNFGFLSGMILTIFGSTFIAGRYQETATEANLDWDKIKGRLVSASPGVILSILGTILMVTTILKTSKAELDFHPQYVVAVKPENSHNNTSEPNNDIAKKSTRLGTLLKDVKNLIEAKKIPEAKKLLSEAKEMLGNTDFGTRQKTYDELISGIEKDLSGKK